MPFPMIPNEARALLLLESVGIIKIKENAGLAATAQDIIENPYEVQIKELDAAQLTRSLPDVNLPSLTEILRCRPV